MEEDFLEALALLRSNEEDSAEKLRKMLDALIESRYGTTKMLAFRMPKEFLQKERIPWKTYSKNSVRLVAERKKETDEVKNEKNERIIGKEEAVNISKIDFEDVGNEEGEEVEEEEDKIDVPRISIPDEGTTDGILCKICNGAKLGPLILLECQECQEIYHPLCHNPPVIDIDVYDPRLVWRCGKCVEAAASSSSTFRETPFEDSMPDSGRKMANKFATVRTIEVEGKKRCYKVNEREKGTKRRH